MGVDVSDDAVPQPDLAGAGARRRFAVVCGRFNGHVTLRLLEGARRGFADCSVAEGDVHVHWVPGAFELPLAAKTFAQTGRYDAVLALGCVIRGDTAHFEYVAGQAAEGLQRAGLDTGVPCVFGVLTTEDLQQALDRSEGPGGHNVGEEGARTAVEMAQLLARVRSG